MRRSASLLIPLTLILLYYGFWVGVTSVVIDKYPAVLEYLPVAGVSDLASSNRGLSSDEVFEPIYTSVERTLYSPSGPLRLLLASIGAIILTIPISWVYFITSRARRNRCCRSVN